MGSNTPSPLPVIPWAHISIIGCVVVVFEIAENAKKNRGFQKEQHMRFPVSPPHIGSPILHSVHKGADRPVGIPFVLVPGAYGSSASWHPRFLDVLAGATQHVMCVDPRGTGRSPRAGDGRVARCGEGEEDVPYTLDDMAGDVVRTMTTHRIREAHVVGMSMGGSVALRMAALYPDTVSTLTLLSTTSARGIWDEGQARPLMSAVEAMERDALLHSLGETEAALIDSYVSHTAPDVPSALEAERYARRVVRHGFDLGAGHGEAFARSGSAARLLPRVRAPTLIVHGSDDALFPAPHAHLMHDLIPKSRLHWERGMGHAMTERRCRRVGRLVAQFASQNVSRRVLEGTQQ